MLYQTGHENVDETAHEHVTMCTESQEYFLRQDVEGQGKVKEQHGDRTSLKVGYAWRRMHGWSLTSADGGKMDLRIEGLIDTGVWRGQKDAVSSKQRPVPAAASCTVGDRPLKQPVVGSVGSGQFVPVSPAV